MVPDDGIRVWSLFWALERRRQNNGYGANPVSHQEIESAARLYGIRLRTWEVMALDKMEVIRMSWHREPNKEQIADKPLTPELFATIIEGKKS